MQTRIISKMAISCGDCGATISCNLAVHFGKDFICPVCGASLNSDFDRAMKTAFAYNKAVMELIECQKECRVDFSEQ